MALIGKIREKKWLLVGTLAGALMLFIGQLMFDNPNQSLFGSSQTSVGKIAGREVDNREFNRTYDFLYGQQQSGSDGYSERTSLWNFYVDEAIVQKEAEAIGIGVGKAELLELQFSQDDSRLSPIISSRYANPQTRQVDHQQLDQLKDIITTNKVNDMIQQQQLVADFKLRWAHQEKEIIKDRLQTKITNMVSKAMYTPSWQAEMIANDQNLKMDFVYVQVPYDAIENSNVALADKDYEAYFAENKNLFKQDEESRKVEYLAFDVKATAADSAAIRQRVADLTDDFAAATNDSVFVESNRGTINGSYFKKDGLNPAIADTLYKVAIGAVVGPYFDGDSYKAAKLLSKRVLADSVKARHILLRAENPAQALAAQKTIDSLKTLIESGAARFDSLAARFSQDQSNALKGGDLGFFQQGRMMAEFNDVCFLKGEPGKVYSVKTEFGVHLLEVTDRKFGTGESVRVAYIAEPVIPSTETQNAVREQALLIQEQSTTLEDLRKAAAGKGMEVVTSQALKSNDFSLGALGTGAAARSMIKWAFGTDPNSKPAKVGMVSPEVYSFQAQGQVYANKYVVAGLKSIRSKGVPSMAAVKDEMEAQVINRKKAEMIAANLKGKTDLASVVAAYPSTKIDTAMNVTYAATNIPNKGAEPKVVAGAFKVEVNQVSQPLTGSSGVFVIMPINKPAAAGPAANVAQVRQSLQNSARSMAKARMVQVLRKGVDIKDNRSKFF